MPTIPKPALATAPSTSLCLQPGLEYQACRVRIDVLGTDARLYQQARSARALKAPLDVLVVRKLGVPDQPELAMGAVASGGMLVVNPDVVSSLGISEATIHATAERQHAEVRRREVLFRGDLPGIDVAGRVVIVVDDGLATGATMIAAVRWARPRTSPR